MCDDSPHHGINVRFAEDLIGRMKEASELVIEVPDILEECSQLRCIHGTPFDPVPDTVPSRVHFRRIIDKLWFHLIENTTEGPFGNLDLLELLIGDGKIQAIVTP